MAVNYEMIKTRLDKLEEQNAVLTEQVSFLMQVGGHSEVVEAETVDADDNTETEDTQG